MSGGKFDAWLWTAEQRRILIIALSCLTLFLAVRLYRNRQSVPDPLPAVGPRASEVQSQFDLNTIDAITLGAIPRLGEIKARAIVDYRTNFSAKHGGRRAFERMEDLYHVKGIGVGTVASLRQYLFITPATTRPTSRP